jgi:hypothetical protein
MGYGEYGVAVTSFLDRRKMERTVLRVPGPWVWELYETKEVLPVTGKQTQIKQEDL